jgi:hypothetical protein
MFVSLKEIDYKALGLDLLVVAKLVITFKSKFPDKGTWNLQKAQKGSTKFKSFTFQLLSYSEKFLLLRGSIYDCYWTFNV